MDAEGGSNSIRPFALKALAERPAVLSGALHMAPEWAAPSPVPLTQGQFSHSPVLVQLLKPHRSSPKSSSPSVHWHNCNKQALTLWKAFCSHCAAQQYWLFLRVGAGFIHLSSSLPLRRYSKLIATTSFLPLVQLTPKKMLPK